MFRYGILLIMLLSLFQLVSWGEDKTPVFTQKDFAILILNQLSWSDGLPKEPADRDYLMVLGGKRTFRYEAENAYNVETDRVTMRDFPLYGPFAGKGWILGVSDATSASFTILLPIAGEYDLKAVIKGNGFVWNINDKEYRVDSKSGNFRETDIAKVTLKAGVTTINVTIPPEGGIDSFSLKAPDYTPIQPFIGWRFREGLTAARMAEVAVALTNRYAQLPDAGGAGSPKPLAVFEKAVLPPTATYTTAPYLGRFSSAKWIRADYRGATLQIPFTVAESGYYGLTVNAMGESISGSVNDTPFKLSGKPYLDKLNLGLHRLESGDNTLTVILPPTGGIDSVEFNRKRATPEDFLRLSGVPGPADRLIGAEEAGTFLKSIRGSSSIRK
ncbi:MAG: hypothetical protein WA003_15880 [Desulfuromonadaceae bacterium]